MVEQSSVGLEDGTRSEPWAEGWLLPLRQEEEMKDQML